MSHLFEIKEKQFEGKGKLGFGMCHYQVGLTDQAITILEGSMKEVFNLYISINKKERRIGYNFYS